MHRASPARCKGSAVRPIRPDRCREALKRLSGQGPIPTGTDPSTALRSIGGADPAEQALRTAYGPDGKPTAVVLATPQPGRTALVLSSPVHRRTDIQPLAETARAACEALSPDRAHLAQVLLHHGEAGRRAAFADAGFRHLADLCYLQKPVSRRTRPPTPPSGVTVESYGPARYAAFLAALDASYEQTLDCPGLQGMRRTEDILAGHMATGAFDPRLWTLLRLDGEPAGVLLLNPVPATECAEVVYLGLAPALRGKGLARFLLDRALWQAGRWGERRVTLAVDDRNTPAVRLYRRSGFRPTRHKQAMCFPLAR